MNTFFAFDGVGKRGISAASSRAQQSYAPGEAKAAFLRNLKEDRRLRERRRKDADAVTRIQRFWRGHRARSAVFAQLRSEFDAESVRPESPLRLQVAKLLLFFSPAKDKLRLISVCQKLLSRKHGGVSEPWCCEAATAATLLGRFLLRCLDVLRFVATDVGVSMGPPLRVLEEFAVSSPAGLRLVVERGAYLAVLGQLLEGRVSSEGLDDEPSPKAPSPLAESLLQCQTRALSAVLDIPESAGLLRRFAGDVLGFPGTLNLHYMLPALASWARSSGKAEVLVPRLLEACVVDSSVHGDLAEARQVLVYGLLQLFRDFPYLGREWVGRGLLVLLGEGLERLEASPEGEAMEQDCPTTAQLPPFAVRCVRESLDSSHIVDALISAAFHSGPAAKLNQAVVLKLAQVANAALRLHDGSRMEILLLVRLSFRAEFLRELWECLAEVGSSGPSGSLSDEGRVLAALMKGTAVAAVDRDHFAPLLALFCSLFANLLTAIDDNEFYKTNEDKPVGSLMPFSRKEMVWLCVVFRDVALSLIERSFPDADVTSKLSSGYKAVVRNIQGFRDRREVEKGAAVWSDLFTSVTGLLSLLQERDGRLGFCPEDFWSRHRHPNLIRLHMLRKEKREAVELFAVQGGRLTREELEEVRGVVLSPSELRSLTVLRQLPFLVPFQERVKILHNVMAAEKKELGIGRDAFSLGPAIHVRVRRNRLYEDAFESLSLENEPTLKPRMVVSMQNWAGAAEAGIDGGGLFREFLAQLLSAGFEPQRGLFRETEERLLYPNPLALTLYADSYTRHFHFLGRMLGKLLYESQLAELHFAPFFLGKLQLRGASAKTDLHHLKTLDPTIYKNLMQLKTTNENVLEWDLDFSIIVDELGALREVELKPGGREVRVNNSNKLEYVHLMADYYLNKQMAPATSAFMAGLSSMVDPDWLGLFSAGELQTLISGKDEDIDVGDMAAHTVYSGGYSPAHPSIEAFWVVVAGLSREGQWKLLKFITACSRPPLRGFRDLFPPLTIQLVADTSRLPTAATCMNFLKLPAYEDVGQMRERITYAIESAAGFELS